LDEHKFPEHNAVHIGKSKEGWRKRTSNKPNRG